MLRWLNKELIPILWPSKELEVLLAYDYASFYKTNQIKTKLKQDLYYLQLSLGAVQSITAFGYSS